MTSMKFPIYNFNFILILTLILWTRLGKRELLDRAIYFNLNIGGCKDIRDMEIQDYTHLV